MSQFSTPADWNVTSTTTVFQISANGSATSAALVTSYESAVVRNIITAVFVLLNFLLATMGGEYVKSRARRSIARGQPVPVRNLTSWLGLSDLAKYTWSLRSLPGGWLGYLMIFTSVLGVLHQFLTNTLVTPTLIPTRCVFDYGASYPDQYTSRMPATDDGPAIQVCQSQLATLKNGGTQGVYKHLFADNEVPMFRPDVSDLSGDWTCVNIRNDSVPWTGAVSFGEPGTGIPYEEFLLSLNTTAHVFPFAPMAYDGTTVTKDGDAYLQGFLIWSAQNATTIDAIRASVLTLSVPTNAKPQAMDFDCALTLDRPVPPMEVQTVLNNWAGKAYGYQTMCDSMENCGLWLELTLNAITMLALFNDNTVVLNIEPPEDIGCVVQGTRVSVGIFLILAVIAMSVLLLVLMELYVLLASLRLPLKKRAALLPFGLADWQLATYHQCSGQPETVLRDLRNFYFRYESSDDTIRLTSTATDPKRASQKLRSSTSSVQSEFSNDAVFGTVGGRAGRWSSAPLKNRQKPSMQTYMQVPSSTES